MSFNFDINNIDQLEPILKDWEMPNAPIFNEEKYIVDAGYMPFAVHENLDVSQSGFMSGLSEVVNNLDPQLRDFELKRYYAETDIMGDLGEAMHIHNPKLDDINNFNPQLWGGVNPNHEMKYAENEGFWILSNMNSMPPTKHVQYGDTDMHLMIGMRNMMEQNVINSVGCLLENTAFGVKVDDVGPQNTEIIGQTMPSVELTHHGTIIVNSGMFVHDIMTRLIDLNLPVLKSILENNNIAMKPKATKVNVLLRLLIHLHPTHTPQFSKCDDKPIKNSNEMVQHVKLHPLESGFLYFGFQRFTANWEYMSCELPKWLERCHKDEFAATKSQFKPQDYTRSPHTLLSHHLRVLNKGSLVTEHMRPIHNRIMAELNEMYPIMMIGKQGGQWVWV